MESSNHAVPVRRTSGRKSENVQSNCCQNINVKKTTSGQKLRQKFRYLLLKNHSGSLLIRLWWRQCNKGTHLLYLIVSVAIILQKLKLNIVVIIISFMTRSHSIQPCLLNNLIYNQVSMAISFQFTPPNHK